MESQLNDPRFIKLPPRGKDCLNCGHHRMNGKAIECHHPERPAEIREVVRWAKGCPQHIPLQ
ncbi:MAG: hypothetical protein ACK4K3_07495 [Aquabacterium sp.]